jgi:hypothetical protein
MLGRCIDAYCISRLYCSIRRSICIWWYVFEYRIDEERVDAL